MKLVLLQPTPADADSSAGLRSMQQALERLGHQVETVTLQPPLSRSVARLEACRADIVWPLLTPSELVAHGPFLFGLLERLGLPSLDAKSGPLLPPHLAQPADWQTWVANRLASASASPGRTPPAKAVWRVGVAYNLKSQDAEGLLHDDSQAEFDSPTTVQALLQAIAACGHEAVALEATPDFAQKVVAAQVQLVFNIAEGVRGRHRESQIPAILELLDIPYTGSDPSCLCLTLDKGLAKRIVAQTGIPTPAWTVMATGHEKLPPELEFPVIVKPLAEGSSKGLGQANVVHTEIALRALVQELVARYRQPALVEQFVGGREFTVGLLGESEPRVLPIMEVVFQGSHEAYPIYGFEQKIEGNTEVRFDCPAQLDAELQATLEQQARQAFRALGCRDVARLDFRMDGEGRVHFIECNPLPGLTPNFSDLAVIGLAAGLDYPALVGEILAPCLERARLRWGAGHESA